jgi:thioredoxin 1
MEIVLKDYYADWCAPCKIMSPIVDKIGVDNPNIKIEKVNVDENQEEVDKYSIQSMPTFIIFKDGIEFSRIVGADKKALEKVVQECQLK